MLKQQTITSTIAKTLAHSNDVQKSTHQETHQETYQGHPDLPIADISGLYSDNPAEVIACAKRIGNQAKDNGFLYINNHGISPLLIDSVYSQAKNFFDQPLARKLDNYVAKQSHHRGYVPTTEKGDYADETGPRRYEAFDLGLDLPSDDEDYLAGNPLLGPNVWPKIFGFKPILNRYYQQVSELAQHLCMAFEIYLGLPNGFFQQHMTKPVSQLRLIHYQENQSEALKTGEDVNMGAHTDYECFTLLHSKQAGLQILNLEDEWIDAPPLDNMFYFNIGDMLELWSNGQLTATPHRVRNDGSERYSLPYFCATNYDTTVHPIPVDIKEKRTNKVYQPIVAGEHLVRQMLRDFPYMLARYEQGKIALSGTGPSSNPFESRIACEATN